MLLHDRAESGHRYLDQSIVQLFRPLQLPNGLSAVTTSSIAISVVTADECHSRATVLIKGSLAAYEARYGSVLLRKGVETRLLQQ